jgi:hypothetical protein
MPEIIQSAWGYYNNNTKPLSVVDPNATYSYKNTSTTQISTDALFTVTNFLADESMEHFFINARPTLNDTVVSQAYVLNRTIVGGYEVFYADPMITINDDLVPVENKHGVPTFVVNVMSRQQLNDITFIAGIYKGSTADTLYVLHSHYDKTGDRPTSILVRYKIDVSINWNQEVTLWMNEAGDSVIIVNGSQTTGFYREGLLWKEGLRRFTGEVYTLSGLNTTGNQYRGWIRYGGNNDNVRAWSLLSADEQGFTRATAIGNKLGGTIAWEADATNTYTNNANKGGKDIGYAITEYVVGILDFARSANNKVRVFSLNDSLTWTQAYTIPDTTLQYKDPAYPTRLVLDKAQVVNGQTRHGFAIVTSMPVQADGKFKIRVDVYEYTKNVI